MDETSGCGARRALNARERSGDVTSSDERRRDERRRAATSGDAERQERSRSSEARAKPKCATSARSRSVTSPLDQVLEKGRSRAAGLPTYQFLRSSTSARAARARLRTKLDRPTDRCPPPTQLSHEMQSPEPTELEIA